MDSNRNKDESYQLVMNGNEMIGGSKSLTTANDENKFIVSDPLVVNLVVVIFGISAWIGVNGIYIQLPLLVITAPEKWNLAAYLVVIIQAANIGPATYTVTRKFYHLNESRCIYVLLCIGSVAIGLLSFFYKTTFYLGGMTEHSVILFVCGFLAGLVGCTSSVLFMPYLRNSSEKYLVYYFIGEGLSGVLPSVVALLQGVGGTNPECININGNETIVDVYPQPRFSSRHYFIFIFILLLLSLLSFILLQYLLSIKNKHSSRTSINSNQQPPIILKTNDTRCSMLTVINNSYAINNNNNNNDISKMSQVVNSQSIITISRTIYLYILVGFICFFGNGLLPGIQTYSCLPYGNIAFHLTVTLANIANPTACLIYLWINSINLKVFDALTLVGIITCAYATYLAVMSPKPPMQNSIVGIIFVVVAWILLTGIISYLKLFITSIVREKLGPGALVGIGMVMQLGSACGALFSFALINYTSLFRQTKPCTPL